MPPVRGSIWPGKWLQPPHRLLILFLTLTLVLAVALGLLRWRLMSRLEDVIEHYNKGGNDNPHLDPLCA